MMLRISALFFALCMVSSVSRAATLEGTDWQSNTATSAQGVVHGVDVEVTGFLPVGTPVGIGTFDLSGPDYSAGPLATDQEIVTFQSPSPWTATFDTPVEDLLLYLIFWRGAIIGGGADPLTYDYTFDQPFTILSGLTNPNTAVVGNTLKVGAQGSPVGGSGIIRFDGPISSLSVIATTSTGAPHIMTFGLVVPEPASLALLALGGLMLGFRGRRRILG